MSLVKQMREAQREYFRTRSRESLQASKALEKRVDEEIQRVEGLANNTHVLTDYERRMLSNSNSNSNAAPQAPDCIVLADGRRLVQGNLFEQP